MKIVDLKTFRELPAGTICMKYKPCVFGDLFVKGDTLEHDFLLEYITNEIDANDSDEFFDKLFVAQKTGCSVSMDFDVTMRDVLFLSHAKPQTEEQAGVWKRLIEGTLEPPDTWEVALSSGKNKKETWERLLKENKLGTLALLRNLRNMNEVSVDESLIKEALCGIKIERVLPFRFIAAAKYAPNLEPELERSMFKCLSEHEKLTGKTILLVDVSGSMMDKISRKSELSRLDAACGLAMLVREICENVEIITFSNQVIQCPPRCGFALRDVIIKSQIHAGTYMGSAVSTVNKEYSYDRIIVITDEQSHDNVPDPTGKGYVINVASNRNGVGYYKWLHIDGWSEAVISYIQEYERQAQDCLVKDG